MQPVFGTFRVPAVERQSDGVCDINNYGEIGDEIKEPDGLPLNLAMTGFYTFRPMIVHTYQVFEDHFCRRSGYATLKFSEVTDQC